MGLGQPARVDHNNDMPAEGDNYQFAPNNDGVSNNDFGGADIDDISDDYPILDDDGSADNDAGPDDNLAAFIDDLNAVLDHFYNGGILDDDGPDHDGRGESHTAGESDERLG